MVERNVFHKVTEQDFALDQPELALVQLRREIEDRLRWLEVSLLPNHAGPFTGPPGKALLDGKILDKKLYDAISDLLQLANPAAHGQTVPRSIAALIIGAGVKVTDSLMSLIQATERKITGMSPEQALVYRFMELPTPTRIEVATSLDLATPEDYRKSRKDFAVMVFIRAREEGKLESLWGKVAASVPEWTSLQNPFRRR